jgi:hypothetical protein
VSHTIRFAITAVVVYVVLLVLGWIFRDDPHGLREWNDE